jgi:hypothetical protein
MYQTQPHPHSQNRKQAKGRRLVITTLALFAVLLSGFLCHSANGLDIYVAVNGDDANPGSPSKPVATIQRAQEIIRQCKSTQSLAEEAMTVYIRGGNYFLESPIRITKEDSGGENFPVLYTAYKNETVRFIGGAQLEPKWFKPVTSQSPVWVRLDEAAKGKVLQINLKEHGITNYGSMRVRGFSKRHVQSPMELVFNGQAMQLARWPNEGFATTTSAKDDIQFGYSEDRPSRWTQAADPWAFGYFCHGWADEFDPIESIDTENKTITLGKKPGYGIKPEKGWYALNLLEEIDMPGEWFLDRGEGILYFWPPQKIQGSEILVSMLGENTEPLLHIHNARYITFKNIAFESGRFDGIQIKKSDHILIDGGKICNMGNQGITIDGSYCGIKNCDIYGVGADGASLSGGDRNTLISGMNYIRNCHIHNFSRLTRTYTPAIRLSGVGNWASNNVIHDGPHSGIMFSGNEHVVEFNDISRCCTESDDAGAFYSGRDWGARGNIIRYNFFHHIQSSLIGAHGVHAVYLDDCLSGVKVFGNVFYNISGRAVMCGGGRDNHIENNVMVNCGSAHFTDRRGIKWVVDEKGSSWNLLEKINRYNYTQPPWSTAYPKLASILANGYEQAKNPEGCVIRNNIGWNNKKWMEKNCLGACGGFDFYTIENNIENQDPRFVDLDNLNLALRPDSPAYSLPGFQTIPFEKIGLYGDRAKNGYPLQSAIDQ